MKYNSISYFDSEAENYDSWYETEPGKLVLGIESDVVFEMLNPQKGEKIIDIGCGTGVFSISLAKKGCRVTGIDVSEKMLEKGRLNAEKFNEDIDFTAADASMLPFKDNTFDSAVSVTAFEFMNDINKSFSEILRVVKKGGRIVIGTINKKSSWGYFYESEALQKKSVFRAAGFLDRAVMDGLHRAGLKEIRECLFFPPDIKKELISNNIENEYKDKNSGGFLCGLWIK